ncbi:hypothetical protein ACHAPU_005734 [Fusarium lateritium]
MEVVSIISSIVQLVDFGSKCIAKGVELYRSSDAILDENAAVQIDVVHLTRLHDEVKSSAILVTDQELQDVCNTVAKTSSELLQYLERLSLKGTKTKWESMRKAIESVCGKRKIQELEHNLSRVRDTLNLLISARIRQQLYALQSEIASRFTSWDLTTKEVLDAIVNNRDIFKTAVLDQTILITNLHEDTMSRIDQNKGTMILRIEDIAKQWGQASQQQHVRTRQEIQENECRVIAANMDAKHEVVRTIQSASTSQLEAIELNAEMNTEQHEQSRVAFQDIVTLLQILSAQMTANEQEVKDLRVAFEASTSQRERQIINERSNAVTAAIWAVKIKYDSFQVSAFIFGHWGTFY